MAGKNSDGRVKCSFCGKSQGMARKLIAGPQGSGVFICDECIEICNDIIMEEFDDIDREEEQEVEVDINLLKPIEIKNFLDEYVIGQEDAKKVLEEILPSDLCRNKKERDNLNLSPKEFIQRYTHELEYPEIALKGIGEKNECILYSHDIQGCSIHKVKPMQCVMFPLVPENLKKDYFYKTP